MDTPWVSCTCPLGVCIPRDPVCNLWLTYLVPLCVPAPFLCVYLCLSFPLSCMYTCFPLSLWIPVCTYPSALSMGVHVHQAPPTPLKLCVYLVTPSLCMLKILFVIRGELMPWFWNLIDFHPSILITAGLIGLRQICKLSLFFTGK